nr:hypothetical protein [Tanacetum cinerariifolium]
SKGYTRNDLCFCITNILNEKAIEEYAEKEKKHPCFFNGERFGSLSSKETNNLNNERRKGDSSRSVLRKGCKRYWWDKTLLVTTKGRKRLLAYTRRRGTRVGSAKGNPFVFAVNATHE